MRAEEEKRTRRGAWSRAQECQSPVSCKNNLRLKNDPKNKIFSNEEQNADYYLAINEKEIRSSKVWNASPSAGDIMNDETVITTLMTEEQLADQKYKKEQYFGRVFYGGLIFLGFVIVYVVIIA